jgi:hypothetical protein
LFTSSHLSAAALRSMQSESRSRRSIAIVVAHWVHPHAFRTEPTHCRRKSSSHGRHATGPAIPQPPRDLPLA